MYELIKKQVTHYACSGLSKSIFCENSLNLKLSNFILKIS